MSLVKKRKYPSLLNSMQWILDMTSKIGVEKTSSIKTKNYLLYGDTNLPPPQKKKFFRGEWHHVHSRRVSISMCSSRLHVFIYCYRQVAYLRFEVRVMALNDLVAKIYRCLHEMYATFGTNTKVQFGCLLSTVLFSNKNQHCFVRNKSMEEMCHFTLLALISVRKIYYFNLPSCVAR